MNIKYITKLLFLNPFQLLSEVKEDFKKDKKYKFNSSKKRKIFIAGLPKSGTTLIEEILEQLPYVRMNRSPLRNFKKSSTKYDKYGYDEFDERILNQFDNNKFSFFKTHILLNEKTIEILEKKNFHIILSFRDIRDVMISRYFHIINSKDHWSYEEISKLNKKDGFIRSMQSYKNNPIGIKMAPLEQYYYWLKFSKKIKNSPNISKLWYEDYLNKPKNFIEKIIKDLNLVGFDSNKIENNLIIKRNLEKNSNLGTKLKRSGKNVSTFREGNKDYWKSFFDEQILEVFNANLPGSIDEVLNN